MNFIDAYDVPGSATPPTGSTNEQPQQSLNEEVTQVFGQLNRFWGGFRKQSQTALEIARKDFGSVVEQAQRELTKLNTPAAAESQAATEEDSSTTDPTTPRAGPSAKLDDDDNSPGSATTETPETSASTSFSPQSLFTRLQSSLPPNIVSTVQSHIPPLESIRHAASESVDFAQLKTTLTSEFQRVQGVTRAQAEGYVLKSEELLREAVKEAGEFIKEAVKVVPPEGQGDASVGVLWDGSDVWMIPSTYSENTASGSGKDKENGGERSSGEARRAVATRAESLLRRLRHDPEVARTDPQADEGVKALYAEWHQREVADKGGIASPGWLEKREAASNLLDDAAEFKALQGSLVPSALTEDEFWTRYFFRAYQIDREADRRKALLQGTSESEDAFSWEDDEDEPTSPKASTAPPVKSILTEPSVPAIATPGNLSPRESEESYDVVSSSGEEPVAPAPSPAPKPPKPEVQQKPAAKPETKEESEEEEDDDEEADSDWE